MWYTNSYRRHLCDMHIDDWDEKFLSQFSPDAYYENLKKANIQNAMLYFQSHVGLLHIAKLNGRFYGVKRPHSESKRPENISLIHCSRP